MPVINILSNLDVVSYISKFLDYSDFISFKITNKKINKELENNVNTLIIYNNNKKDYYMYKYNLDISNISVNLEYILCKNLFSSYIIRLLNYVNVVSLGKKEIIVTCMYDTMYNCYDLFNTIQGYKFRQKIFLKLDIIMDDAECSNNFINNLNKLKVKYDKIENNLGVINYNK